MSAAYPADLYEAVHVGTPGDLDFYKFVTAGAASILELGCGYGRVLSALAAPRLVGVDLDPDLVARAQARLGDAAQVVVGDMRTLVLALDAALGPEETFDFIVAPYSTLFCLDSEEDLVATLTGARRLLGPTGRLAFDVWYADDFHGSADPDDPEGEEFEPVAEAVIDGVRYAVLERSRWEKEAQRLVVDYRHLPADGNPSRDGRIVHRYFTRAQLPAILEAAGLEVAEEGVVETEAGESLSVVARPRG